MIMQEHRQEKETQIGWQVFVRRLTCAAAVGLALFTVLTLAAATLCLSVDVPREKLTLVALPIAVLGAAAAGFLHVRPTRRQGLLQGLLAAALLYVLVLTAALVLTRQTLGTHAVLLLLAMLGGGAVGGVFAANRPVSEKRARHRPRHGK
ncbi:MAG: TIGR04086 family membrane protein [Oscillospiraceae bacterium]|nr:TIGR04086 family membrane protein [Oscillospiraceae bacterium]